MAKARHPWGRWELGYSSNVHPAPDLEAASRVVEQEVAGVRALRGLARMGAGLWLSARAAAELHRRPGALLALKALLERSGLALFTLNGFPYGDFHQTRVKEAVYRPDWAEPRRLGYTLDLACILASCLPADCGEGSISTLPLGYDHGWNDGRRERALAALCRLVEELVQLRRTTGRHIRVCLEMEPGCVLERTEQAVELFTAGLPAAARVHGLSPATLREHLGVCFDVCHQAVMFENAAASLERLAAAGIAVGKIQISSALELSRPAAEDPTVLLTPFAEPRYLHQVRTRNGDTLAGTGDLDAALAPGALPRDGPWRIHFHVPVQGAALAHGALATTRGAIGEVLDFLAAHPEQRPHLEVETYTWQVLPPALRPADAAALRRGLAGELDWLEREMNARGLLA